MIKRKTIKVGDVFQILTSEGVCYGQVIHTHPKYKFVVAIFREFYSKRPLDFAPIVAQTPQLITPFLIQHGVKQGLFTLVDNIPVADQHKAFPIFRGTNNPGEGDETLWWFWDGEKEWRIDRPLIDEEKKYPRKALPSAPMLIEWIENDYRVERDYI